MKQYTGATEPTCVAKGDWRERKQMLAPVFPLWALEIEVIEWGWIEGLELAER